MHFEFPWDIIFLSFTLAFALLLTTDGKLWTIISTSYPLNDNFCNIWVPVGPY